jgi:hypothetical protein
MTVGARLPDQINGRACLAPTIDYMHDLIAYIA